MQGGASSLFAWAVLLLLLIQHPSSAQNSNETGLFSIRNYSPQEYNLVPQNFAIVQDQRGVMYFGNNSGILEYDGKTWNSILTPTQTPVHSLTISRQGKIFVGGTGEIGFLSPDSSGKLTYRSLLNFIPEKDRNFSEIWKCFATPTGLVYFQASNKIFRWNGHQMKIWDAKTAFHVMFYLNGTLYVREKEQGLKFMADTSLVLIQGGELFAEQKIYFMLPFLHREILLNAQGKGLFIMKKGAGGNASSIGNTDQLTRVFPFHTRIDDFISSNELYNCIRLNETNFSLGTLGAGIAVIDSAGNLIEAIGKNTGLKDGSVYDQLLDTSGKLWLATNNGISKVDINSPITSFNDRNGLEGTVQSILRHENKLFAATNVGVFYLRAQTMAKGSALIEAPQFIRLPGISSECWDLLSFQQDGQSRLLVATNAGTIQIEGDKASLVVNGDASVLHRSVRDPNRIFIGLTSGISSIYWKHGQWIDEGKVKGITEYIRTIAEDKDGSLWLGNNDNGTERIQFTLQGNKIASVQVSKFGTAQGLPDENVFVKSLDGRMYFATPKGLYRFYQEFFYPDSSLGTPFAKGQAGVFRMSRDGKGKIWIIKTIQQKDMHMEIGYILPGKQNPVWYGTPFMGLSKSITLSVYHDDDGITWLGGPDGIYRFNENIHKEYGHDYCALVRKVILGKDSVLFAGAYFNDSGFVSLSQPERLKHMLPYSHNSFIFQFAAPDFEGEATTRYSYFLEGFDKQWTGWKNENKAVYTNLPEGQYFFKVKAKNMFGKESREAVYEFTILAPWYRTFWAYAGYLFLFVGFVYGAVTVSTRSLRNIIQERTAEVVKQKEVIELKNKDITDSINYAKRIQEAILPTRENFNSLFPESFILFKPKDIVSGDFYWLSEKNGMALIAAADCTGHGVPGAFTSMIGNALLNEIVNDRTILEPGKILDALREGIIKALKQSGKEGESKDGMDISLCAIDFKAMELQYAGAYNPLFLIRNGELIEIKADKYPIGISDRRSQFTNHKMELKKGDTFYIFSDGYADQFGGPDGKKYMRKRFKELLLEMQHISMEVQGRALDKSIVNWQGANEQVDDILIIGIRM
jgi:serine phosphatase RsbU (regulator of sigma subunit)/ligand-binding sensor domain-containing protein